MPRTPKQRRALVYRLLRRAANIMATDFPDDLPVITALLERYSPWQHSDDFTSIRWNGDDYCLTAAQARIVRALWRNWKRGVPALRQESLIEEAACESERVGDVFKNSPAWGNLVVPGDTKGTFRLAPTVED